MFLINPAPTFPGTVRLTVPGSADVAVLQLIFKHQGRQALSDWIARPTRVREQGGQISDADYLGEVIAGWPDGQVHGADGAAVPFSPAALSALLDAYPAASQEIFAAYLTALTESRAKN